MNVTHHDLLAQFYADRRADGNLPRNLSREVPSVFIEVYDVAADP